MLNLLRNFKYCSIIFIIQIAFNSSNSFSKDITKDSLKMKDVVVYGDKFLPVFSNNTTTNHFLSKEQINYVHPDKLMESLIFLPGVLNATNALGGPTIVIRGQEQNRVNIFFNGIPIRSNMENNLPMDNFFLSNTDIFLEKGSSSLIYGSNSGGSVLQIENGNHFDEKFGLNLNTFWGDNGKQSYNIKLSGTIANDFKYLFSTNYLKRNSIQLSKQFDTVPAQNNFHRNNSDQNNLELIGIISYKFNENHNICLTTMYDNGDYGYAPSIIKPRFRRMTQFKNLVTGLRSISVFKNDYKLESSIYYTNLNDTLAEFTDATYTKQKRYSHWVDESIGFRLIASKIIDSLHIFNLSFDAKQDIHNQDWNNIIATTKSNTIITTLEYRTKLLNYINLNSGLSYNSINPFYTSLGKIPNNSLSAFNYQLSLGYFPNNNLYKLHLGYNRTTIFPRMRDFFGIDLIPGYIPNPNLKEETNNNFDLGVDYLILKNELQANLSFFYNTINNLIIDVRINDTTTQTQNINSALFYGSELMLKYTPNKEMYANISYTYLCSKNTSTNRTSDLIAYRPEHYLKIYLMYSPNQYFGVNFALTYASKQFYNNTTYWGTISDYSIFDIGLQSKPIKTATIWFKINNIFDKNWFSIFDQPQAGREYRLGITYDLKLANE